MRVPVEIRCIVCQLIFCCADCRWKHEQGTHGLLYDCPICRGFGFLCKPEELNEEFIEHLHKKHMPLQCKKCNKLFKKMEDFVNIDKCTTISELIGKETQVSVQTKEIDDKFDSIYEKIASSEGDNYEGIISINKSSRTAVITPVVRKKHIVDYESSDSEDDKPSMSTPHPKFGFSKIPKVSELGQRVATPHTKKLMKFKRQNAVEEFDETIDDCIESPVSKTTPSRSENEQVLDNQKEITTPTSHVPQLTKLGQAVTTSTPTHPADTVWSLFSDQGTDSPLSEIENAESPAQSINIEPSKSDSDAIPPKLKSIIVTGSKIRLGSQDSSEKHVTFQDSSEGSTKPKKVKFANDTIFDQQSKMKRVFRKPKRMLTPGPQKQKFCFNPRFQALINRFENQGTTMARTPTVFRNAQDQDTPPVGEPSNMQARAIHFKEDSPIIESDSKENELFQTCIGTSDDAITAITANIAGSMQNCLASILTNTTEETEIQIKFVITKRKVSVNRIMEDNATAGQKFSIMDENQVSNKHTIWSSVARAVKNVFWGDKKSNHESTTPHRSISSMDSSSSKRKCDELSDTESPVNHKRYKYEGRIRGRPPLRRSKTCVAGLRTSASAEQKSLINDLALGQDDTMNLSF